MDRAALIRRLRANAQVCRDEQKRETVTPLHKAELANDAREWDEAADALEADVQKEAALKALCDRLPSAIANRSKRGHADRANDLRYVLEEIRAIYGWSDGTEHAKGDT